MRPPNDERSPGQGSGHVGNGQLFDTASVPPAGVKNRPGTRHVIAQGWPVVSRSGKEHLLLLVVRCHCGGSHQHRAQLGFDAGRRRAPCGNSSYVVHAVMANPAAA